MGNIAGVRSDGPVVDITDDEFDRVIDINLRGVFYGCQAALRAMIPQGSGNIVNISSGIVDDPGPTMATYGMTKAAVAVLTKAIAAEGAEYGIRANAIAPGVILSNFSRAHFVDECRRGRPGPLRRLHRMGLHPVADGPGGHARRGGLDDPLPGVRRRQLRHRADHATQRRLAMPW